MIEQRIKRLNDYAKQLPHSKVYFRDSWNCWYYEVAGKNFGRTSPATEERPSLTLKGDPQQNEQLRELYSDIIPGYYANKRLWNSIHLDTKELTDQELYQMLAKSYQLVIQTLPKKQQAALAEPPRRKK